MGETPSSSPRRRNAARPHGCGHDCSRGKACSVSGKPCSASRKPHSASRKPHSPSRRGAGRTADVCGGSPASDAPPHGRMGVCPHTCVHVHACAGGVSVPSHSRCVHSAAGCGCACVTARGPCVCGGMCPARVTAVCPPQWGERAGAVPHTLGCTCRGVRVCTPAPSTRLTLDSVHVRGVEVWAQRGGMCTRVCACAALQVPVPHPPALSIHTRLLRSSRVLGRSLRLLLHHFLLHDFNPHQLLPRHRGWRRAKGPPGWWGPGPPTQYPGAGACRPSGTHTFLHTAPPPPCTIPNADGDTLGAPPHPIEAAAQPRRCAGPPVHTHVPTPHKHTNADAHTQSAHSHTLMQIHTQTTLMSILARTHSHSHTCTRAHTL